MPDTLQLYLGHVIRVCHARMPLTLELNDLCPIAATCTARSFKHVIRQLIVYWA